MTRPTMPQQLYPSSGIEAVLAQQAIIVFFRGEAPDLVIGKTRHLLSPVRQADELPAGIVGIEHIQVAGQAQFCTQTTGIIFVSNGLVWGAITVGIEADT